MCPTLVRAEDTTNRSRLTKLMRFYTSKSPDTLTSFDEYVARMKEGQKDIYYLAGGTPAAAASAVLCAEAVGRQE